MANTCLGHLKSNKTKKRKKEEEGEEEEKEEEGEEEEKEEGVTATVITVQPFAIIGFAMHFLSPGELLEEKCCIMTGR